MIMPHRKGWKKNYRPFLIDQMPLEASRKQRGLKCSKTQALSWVFPHKEHFAPACARLTAMPAQCHSPPYLIPSHPNRTSSPISDPLNSPQSQPWGTLAPLSRGEVCIPELTWVWDQNLCSRVQTILLFADTEKWVTWVSSAAQGRHVFWFP